MHDLFFRSNAFNQSILTTRANFDLSGKEVGGICSRDSLSSLIKNYGAPVMIKPSKGPRGLMGVLITWEIAPATIDSIGAWATAWVFPTENYEFLDIEPIISD